MELMSQNSVDPWASMSELPADGNDWIIAGKGTVLHLFLSPSERDSLEIPPTLTTISGTFHTKVHSLDSQTHLPSHLIGDGDAIVVEVSAQDTKSMTRLDHLVRSGHPVIAAVRDVSVQQMRTLMRSGIRDVVALPLDGAELQPVLEHILAEAVSNDSQQINQGKIISIVGSVGGVGATTVATQMASMNVVRDLAFHRTTCLIDLDVQFGNAASYLSIAAPLSIKTLLDAGKRMDRALLRSATVSSRYGLNVIAAPSEIMPLESIVADQMLRMVDLATEEFDTIFLDLPGSWTNWSLSLLARSNLVILVVELTVASLRQGRRQLELLTVQGLGEIPVMVVVNRVQKKLFKTIDLADAERALAHPVSLSIAADPLFITGALNQGVELEGIQKNSKVVKDLSLILDACAAQLGRGAEA